MNITDHERFSKIWAGVQSIVVSVAVAVGGLWALFTFNAKHEADLARGEYEKLAKELRDFRVLNVKITPTQLRVPGDKGLYVSAIVEIENAGNQTEVFEWPKDPVTIRRVSIDEGGQIRFGRLNGTRVSESRHEKALRIKPRGSFHRWFLAKVDGPGLYYVTFLVESSGPEQDLAKKEGVTERVAWADETYVVVSE
jgi:hypothetical protein